MGKVLPRLILAVCIFAVMAGCAGEFAPQRVPAKTVRAGDITIGYKEFGKGDPLVMIMGYGGMMDLWDPRLVKALALNYRVIMFDNRGIGKTSDPGTEFTIELFADDTARLMDALGIKKAHVLGYSMGASVAQELALKYPQRVSKLVLYAGDCGGAEAIRPGPDVALQLSDSSVELKERIRRLINLLFPDEWIANNPNISEYFSMPKELPSAEILTRQIKAMDTWKGSFSRLGSILEPTLLITGTDDLLTPPANSRLLLQRIPKAQLIEIAGGGHGVMFQSPEEFSSDVLEFLLE